MLVYTAHRHLIISLDVPTCYMRSGSTRVSHTYNLRQYLWIAGVLLAPSGYSFRRFGVYIGNDPVTRWDSLILSYDIRPLFKISWIIGTPEKMVAEVEGRTYGLLVVIQVYTRSSGLLVQFTCSARQPCPSLSLDIVAD